MICPNLSDPVIKEKFNRLQELHPDFAYYLWDRYEGEVPAKYYEISSAQFQLKDNNLSDVEKNIIKLDNYLIDFVSKFGVNVNEVNFIKEKFGIDALGVTDLVNKLILFTEDRQIDTLPEEVAHVAVMMMGKSHPAIFELRAKIQGWDKYQKIKEQYLPIYKNEIQVEIEAVGKLISEAIVSNYKLVGIQPNLIKRTILAIRNFIKDLFSNTIFVSEKNRLNTVADEIALNILKGNYNYIANNKPSGIKLNYNQALNDNPFAKNIIDTFTTNGAKLTGSLALAAQGDVVYRSIQEPIHDLDFNVYSNSAFNKIKRKLDSINAIPMHYGWESKNRNDICYTYLVPAKGFKIINVTRNYLDPSQRVGTFDLVDENNNIVTPTAQNIMPVDFFFEENLEKEKQNTNRIFTPSQDIYAGKLSLSSFGKHERMFNRAKDQKDYILSKPTDYSKPDSAFVYYQVPSAPKPTTLNERQYQLPTQIKQGVSELFEENTELAKIGTPEQYSAYLDTIFSESKVEYRGDTPNLNKFFYSEPTPEKKKQGIAHKIGPGVYTSTDITKAQGFAKDNKGQVYTVLVNTQDALVFKEQLDFLSAVAEYYGLGDAIPSEDLRNQFVRDQAALGKSITVLEFNETTSPVKNTLALGSKRDIEGFKKYVSNQSMPNTMDIRDKEYYELNNKILSKYLQQEKFKQVLIDLLNNPEYDNLPRPQKVKYLQRAIFNQEIRPLEGRQSIEIVNDYTAIVKPTANVYRQSKNRSAYQNFRGYAYSIVTNINKTYAFTYEPVIAKLEELSNGRYQIQFKNDTAYYNQLINFIDRVGLESIQAEAEALTLVEKAAAEADEHLKLMRESNTIVVDGEALPFDGSLYDSRLETMLPISNAEYEKIGKVLNFLSSKFKGVSWSFNSYLDKPAQINLVTGEIQFNPGLINSETVWHEFGHVIVRNIRQNNPELFEELKKEIQTLHDQNPISSSYAIVEAFYPEYAKSDSFWEEAIVTELGRQADVEYRNKEEKTTWQKIFNFFKNLFDFNVTESTKMQDLVDNLLSKEEIEFINSEYSPALQEKMFARVTKGMKLEMLSKAEELIPTDDYEYASFGKKINDFATQILDKDIKGILATAKNIKSEKTLIQESIKSLERIKNLISTKDVAEAYYELATYLKSSNNYLRQIGNAIRLNQENEEIDNSIKIMALHSAHKQAIAFEAQINVLLEMMSDKSKKIIRSLSQKQAEERNQNVVFYNIASIENTIKIIKQEYDENILDPLSEELLSSIKKGNEELKSNYLKQIEKVNKSNVSQQLKDRRIKEIQKKIDEIIDTKAKVKSLFTNPKKLYLSNLWLDSAFMVNNPTLNIVANYIKEGIYDQIPEVQKMNNELQNIQSEITDMLGPNPRAVVDRRSMYGFLVREADYVYVEDGELKTKKVVSLNSKTKKVELQNEITRLKYELENATTPEKQTRIKNLMDSFYEKYTERPFTEEYYAVSNRLPLEVRRKRNEIYDQINALRNLIGTGNFDGNLHSDQETIEMIKDLQMELDDMERLYDYKGQKKTGYELEVAQSIIDWKKDKNSKKLVSYKLTEQSKLAFEIEYKRQLDIYENNLALAKTEEQKIAAQESWDAWRSINVRTTYTQEFYDRREEITARISSLLKGRSTKDLSDRYDELFNILKGQRDSSGVYVPSNYSKELLAKSKELEQDIEDIKALLKKDSKLDPEIKAQLIPLFKELDSLQSTVNSSYYVQTRESILNEIRSEIVKEDPNITDENLNIELNKRYRQSDWFKDNHIVKNRWSDETQSMVSVFEPIFVWRVTRPNDPEYVEQNQPGFVWYKSVINPEFKNPKYKQGEIQFKDQTSGEYFNESYNNLTSKQQDIVERVTALHYDNQKKLYNQDKLGDLIPGMKKTGKDRFIDFVTLGKNPFGRLMERFKNWFQAKDITGAEDVETYGETQSDLTLADLNKDTTKKASKKLFMRLSKPLDASEQSYDILGAIANYGAASYQFRALRNIQATVLAANRSVSDSNVKNLLEKTTDKILYGQSLKGNDTFTKSMNAISRVATSFAGRKSLGLNLISLPQNLVTGVKQNIIMMGSHELSFKSLRRGTIDALLATKDFFLYHGQLGAKPKSLQLLEYFATEQKEYFTRGLSVTNTGIRKWGNILNTINTLREYTEFEIAAQVGFAHLNQYRIKLKDSENTIPLKDAFELKDGVLQLKPNVEDDQELIKFVRNRIYVSQRRAQGIYDKMSQPEADRYALGKLMLFLKRYIASDVKSIYGGSTIHYGAGLETEGSWSAFHQLIRDSVRYKNPIFAYTTATDAVKGGAKKGTLNFAIWIGLVNLLTSLRLLTDCEEDNDANWEDYTCYFLKRIINEVEGGFTLWGMNETIYTYGLEKSNGVTIADKLFGVVSGALGITGRYITSIDEYSNLDPYYRTTGGNVDWDKTHPLLAGKPSLAVGAVEFFGVRGLDIRPQAMEFNNRRFEDYMPKTYGKSLKTKFVKDYELEDVKSRTYQARTYRMFKKQYKLLNEKRKIKSETGGDVSKINAQIQMLRTNYEKRMREAGSMEKQNEKDFPFIPTLFFSDKLQINKEIDIDDLE